MFFAEVEDLKLVSRWHHLTHCADSDFIYFSKKNIYIIFKISLLLLKGTTISTYMSNNIEILVQGRVT